MEMNWFYVFISMEHAFSLLLPTLFKTTIRKEKSNNLGIDFVLLKQKVTVNSLFACISVLKTERAENRPLH